MQIGISAFAWTGQFREQHLPLISEVRELGFAALEIPMFVPGELPVKALRSEFQQQGLQCTVCAILPAGVNPISPDEQVRKRSAEHLKDCVATASELGATLLGGPLLAPIGYLPGHRPTADEHAWAVEALQSLLPLLDATGITLSLEPVNRSETYFLRTADEARSLVEAINHPQIGVTIDTFHANIEEHSIAGAVASLGPRLKHMHLSQNDRSLLSRGPIDFGQTIRALQSIAYDGLLIAEGFGFDAHEPLAPGFLWADPQVSPRALAQDGLQTLQRLLQP